MREVAFGKFSARRRNVAAVYDRRTSKVRAASSINLAAVIDRRYRGIGLGAARRGLPAPPPSTAITDVLLITQLDSSPLLIYPLPRATTPLFSI